MSFTYIKWGICESNFSELRFNIATANQDDHLRNHGFIRLPADWLVIGPGIRHEDQCNLRLCALSRLLGITQTKELII